MTDRRFWASLALFCLLLPMLVAAQGERAQAPAPPSRSSVVLAGREIPVPVTITPGGPLFGLAPLAEALGATLTSDESGESLSLKIDQTEVVIGLGSAIITVGDQIVSLSQPPVQGEGGVQVPLEFLRKTFGDVLGYSFDWRPELSRLAISRRGARELTVALDVVHLQGVTTVVLQFPEAPRYKIEQHAGMVDVQMLADRLTPPATPPAVTDPLVQSVAITPQQIRLQLAADAEVESYVLENPFRLVFDVHRPAAVETPRVQPARPELEAGVRTIVIDPGHGGRQTGAIGPSGVAEKELVLQIARELQGRLEQRLGVRAILTRSEDVELAHDTRAAIANQNRADLFISIHLNSSLGTGAHGAETYFLSTEASDARAARAAETENLGADVLGPDAAPRDVLAAQDLQLILWDLAQTHHLSESQRFATMVQGELNETLQLRDRGVKQAPFRVLMGATMPAVLVELGFLSNPDEEKKLQEAAYRSALVDSLTRAIGRYKALVENRELPAEGTAPAPQQPPAPGGTRPAAPRPGGAGSPP